jgi:hypothetical protein
MPITVKEMIDQMNHSGEGGADAVNQKRKAQYDLQAQQAKGDQDAQLVKLKNYLEGQQEQDRQEGAKKLLNDPAVTDNVNNGGSYSVNPETGAVSIGGNPYAKMQMQGPHQAQALAKTAAGTFKPINDQLDASKATLDNLNLGNDTGDKLALINEARLSLAGSGGKAIGQMVGVLSGDPTMASDGQKALNWLQNTPNVPKLQPAQRDAIRESVYNRLPQIEQQGTQAAQQLTQQAPLVAPQTDGAGIVNGYVAPAQQKLQQLKSMQQDYMKQRQAMQPQSNQISSPSTANAAPTTFDRLKSFFAGTPSPQQQQAPATATVDHSDALAQELAKRAQGALNQPPQGQQPAPQGP